MSDVQWVFAQGGWVSYALAFVSALLWSAIILRALLLRRSGPLDIDATPKGRNVLADFLREARNLRGEPGRLDQLAQRTYRRLGYMRSPIRTLVAVAPLLGLLGTVIGMVEMFGSMQGSLGPSGESTVAGGISTALVTTQLGLVISAPGLIAAHMLTRRQIRRENDVRTVLRVLQEAT